MQQLLKKQVAVNVIGTRHGEKIHETLVSAEELRRSEDMGDYYRVSMDTRDLNYAKFFSEGEIDNEVVDYTSANTDQLDVEGTKELLLSLPEIQAEVG